MIQEVQYDELKKAWEAPQDAKIYREETDDTGAVSYTHLDVYKRQAVDQTRGWFYSLMAISTLLFNKAPYKNVVVLSLIHI